MWRKTVANGNLRRILTNKNFEISSKGSRLASTMIRSKLDIIKLEDSNHRSFSSVKSDGPDDKTKDNSDSDQGMKKVDYDEYDDYEYREPKTLKEKLAVYGQTLFTLSLLIVGGASVIYLGFELFPGRMNPNNLFSEVFDVVKANDKVRRIVGDDAVAFGSDNGRQSEGRRNNVQSYKFKAVDGSDRLRIRFNVKGNRGHIYVWAEVSNRNASGEFVYIICQSSRTGRVYTIVDNREQLDEEAEGLSTDQEAGYFMQAYNTVAKVMTEGPPKVSN